MVKEGSDMSEFNIPEDYLAWYDKMSQTILTRGMTLSREEMRVAGIVEVINYEAAMDDGMTDDERMVYLIRRGTGMGPGYAVWAEAAIRGIKNKSTGEVGYINTYSGIVFRTNIHRDIFCMKNARLFDVKALPICN